MRYLELNASCSWTILSLINYYFNLLNRLLIHLWELIEDLCNILHSPKNH